MPCDRLLEIDEVVLLHAPEGLDRLARRLVALVGVAAERNARPDGLADPPHHLDVAVRIDADLDLDGADAFLRDLRDLALGLREVHQPDRMGDRDAPPARAAEQTMHRKAALLAGEVVGRELDGGLGVGIALDGAIHARMQLGDLARQATRRRRAPDSRVTTSTVVPGLSPK